MDILMGNVINFNFFFLNYKILINLNIDYFFSLKKYKTKIGKTAIYTIERILKFETLI